MMPISPNPLLLESMSKGRPDSPTLSSIRARSVMFAWSCLCLLSLTTACSSSRTRARAVELHVASGGAVQVFDLKAHPLTVLFGVYVCYAVIYTPSEFSVETTDGGEWESRRSLSFRMGKGELAKYHAALEGLHSTVREERKRGFVAGMQDAPIATGAHGEQFMVGYESAVRSLREWNFWLD